MLRLHLAGRIPTIPEVSVIGDTFQKKQLLLALTAVPVLLLYTLMKTFIKQLIKAINLESLPKDIVCTWWPRLHLHPPHLFRSSSLLVAWHTNTHTASQSNGFTPSSLGNLVLTLSYSRRFLRLGTCSDIPIFEETEIVTVLSSENAVNCSDIPYYDTFKISKIFQLSLMTWVTLNLSCVEILLLNQECVGECLRVGARLKLSWRMSGTSRPYFFLGP